MSEESWTPDLFERLYAADPDPWKFETSRYEQDKYADTLAQLEGRRFASGLELGCSIGVLTRALAGQCDRLLSLDLAETALARARLRCRDMDHVRFQNAVLPRDWPDGRFDLVLISEMLYFLSPADLTTLARRCAEAASPDCTVLLVNWTGPTDTPTTGDAAAELFNTALLAAGSGFTLQATLHRDRYRLDRAIQVAYRP